jgi:hypothetical protein
MRRHREPAITSCNYLIALCHRSLVQQRPFTRARSWILRSAVSCVIGLSPWVDIPPRHRFDRKGDSMFVKVHGTVTAPTAHAAQPSSAGPIGAAELHTVRPHPECRQRAVVRDRPSRQHHRHRRYVHPGRGPVRSYAADVRRVGAELEGPSDADYRADAPSGSS